jgi:hypothetical protein
MKPLGMSSAGDDASIERGYQTWLKKNKITRSDVEGQSPYNYRAAYLAGVDPDKEGQLPEQFVTNVPDLDYYPGGPDGIGFYRPVGMAPGKLGDPPPFEPHKGQMDTYYDPKAGINRPWVDKPEKGKTGGCKCP